MVPVPGLEGLEQEPEGNDRIDGAGQFVISFDGMEEYEREAHDEHHRYHREEE